MAIDTKTKRSGGVKIGHRMPISDSLASAVLGSQYATPWRKKPTAISNRGVAAAGQPRPNGRAKEPDNVILEVRRLHEQEGLSPQAISNNLAACNISLDRERVRNICNYTTRSQLIPAAGAPPYIERQAQ